MTITLKANENFSGISQSLSMNDGCETAITRTGWGLCHYFLVGICGFCSLAEASATLIVIVITPLLACDLKFTKTEILIMNSIFSLGMALGGFFFGTLADHNGRKSLIPVTMVVIFCASICLAFARKFLFTTIAILILGIGVAGNNVTLRVYLIECLPSKRRGSCLVLLDLLWALGYLCALGISWSLVPSVVRMLSNEFRPSSWRVLAGLGGSPSLIMACAASLLPASPRYLLYRRNPERALQVLQQIYAINNSQHANNYPSCELEGCIQPDENDEAEVKSVIKAIRRYGNKTWKRFRIIFGSSLRKTAIFSIISRIFLFPGLIWMAMWKAFISYDSGRLWREPRIMENGYDPSICVVDASDIAQSFLHNCQEANNSRFEYSLLLSLSYIVGEGFLFFGIDVVGRRLSLVTSGMIGTTSIIALLIATRRTAQIILSTFFLGAYAIVYTTTSLIILENFPTSVRGTILGLTSVLPHLAAFFVKFYTQSYCIYSVYVAIGLIIGATTTAIIIPDFTKAPMRE